MAYNRKNILWRINEKNIYQKVPSYFSNINRKLFSFKGNSKISIDNNNI